MQQENHSAQPTYTQQSRVMRQQREAARRKRRRRQRLRHGMVGLFGCATIVAALWGGVNYGLPLVSAAFAPPRTFEMSTYDATNYVFDADDPYLVLVNRNVPAVSLAPTLVQADAESAILLEEAAAQAWQSMYAAALADGVTLQLYAGYEDADTVQSAFEEWKTYYMEEGWSETEAAARAATISPTSDASEHSTGLALDILTDEGNEPDTGFAETEAYSWLRARAMEYGFILRYPEERQAATGMVYEPWHWRYVGVENARAIVESGLSLEEFLALNEQNTPAAE